jgi:DNA-binding Xre family transcriptional regulator
MENRIDEVLRQKGWCGLDLIYRAKVSANTLWALRRGYRPGPKALERVCKALDCRPEDILKGGG